MDWNITCCTVHLRCAPRQIDSLTAMVNALAARPELQLRGTLDDRSNVDVVNEVPPLLRTVPRAELPTGAAQNRAEEAGGCFVSAGHLIAPRGASTLMLTTNSSRIPAHRVVDARIVNDVPQKNSATIYSGLLTKQTS
jgi:hypothetical protein